jgi:hypothetical protein
VSVPDGVTDQDEAGRLWDVLTMLRAAIRMSGEAGNELAFRLFVKNRPDADPELVELKSVCGPDDDGRPCVTVMTPAED